MQLVRKEKFKGRNCYIFLVEANSHIRVFEDELTEEQAAIVKPKKPAAKKVKKTDAR